MSVLNYINQKSILHITTTFLSLFRSWLYTLGLNCGLCNKKPCYVFITALYNILVGKTELACIACIYVYLSIVYSICYITTPYLCEY